MMVTKPIKVGEDIKKYLDSKKKYKRETYDEVLRRELKNKLKIK